MQKIFMSERSLINSAENLTNGKPLSMMKERKSNDVVSLVQHLDQVVQDKRRFMIKEFLEK